MAPCRSGRSGARVSGMGVIDIVLFQERARRALERAAQERGVPGPLVESFVDARAHCLRHKLAAALPSLIFLAAGCCFTWSSYPQPVQTAGCLLFITGTVINLVRELQ